MSYAKVYLNGQFVGEHKGGYTPFQFDLTPFVSESNELTVVVDSHERDDIPPFGHVVDYLTYGGIYREVELNYYNEFVIEDLKISTSNVTKQPKVDVQFSLCSRESKQVNLEVEYSLLKDGKEVFERRINVSSTENDVQTSFNIDNVDLWDIDNPNLYHLKCSLIKNNKVIDSVTERFGFREFKFTRNGFYLNNKLTKIIGLNRHQSFPYVGYAMPKSAQYKDAEILKNELGVNTVRLSHYPHSDHFLDRCDELGLLVFDEIPGWQNIGNSEWKRVARQNVIEMIKKDWNRPSIFIWGTRINESQDDHDFYKDTSNIARSLDDTRSVGGVRCIKNSELLEDVYTFNDFSHTGDNEGLEHPSKVFKGDAPYLVTEHNGHMFPTKKYDKESERISHALRHLNVMDSMFKHDEISGAIGWCMFDYNTHKDFGSGDRICYHGVMDMFRIPKYAAYSYASQSNVTPVLEVISSMDIGEYPGGVLGKVYAFTNCDSIKLYDNGKFIKEFFPKNDNYKHLKHPPIVIDDFIGEQIHQDEDFSFNDAEMVKELLLKANETGGKLTLVEKLKMAYVFIKYKISFKYAEEIFNRYFDGWGDEAKSYTIEGIKEGKVVRKVIKGKSFNPVFHIESDANKLCEEETYDVTRVIVRIKDEFKNDITYSNESFTIETNEYLEVIGPKVLSLIGGSVGFWVKTTGIAGEGEITVSSPRFGDIKNKILVTVDRRS